MRDYTASAWKTLSLPRKIIFISFLVFAFPKTVVWWLNERWLVSHAADPSRASFSILRTHTHTGSIKVMSRYWTRATEFIKSLKWKIVRFQLLRCSMEFTGAQKTTRYLILFFRSLLFSGNYEKKSVFLRRWKRREKKIGIVNNIQLCKKSPFFRSRAPILIAGSFLCVTVRLLRFLLLFFGCVVGDYWLIWFLWKSTIVWRFNVRKFFLRFLLFSLFTIKKTFSFSAVACHVIDETQYRGILLRLPFRVDWTVLWMKYLLFLTENISYFTASPNRWSKRECFLLKCLECQERHFTASRTMEGRLARCIKNENHKPDDDEVTTTESLEKVDLKCQMFVIESD